METFIKVHLENNGNGNITYLTCRMLQNWALMQISRLKWLHKLRKNLKCKNKSVLGMEEKINVANRVNVIKGEKPTNN